jgi:hypothetical protein
MEPLELSFALKMLLAFGGFVFHVLKQWRENIVRKQVFDVRLLIISVLMNCIAIPILIFIGGTLPDDLLVMSPLTCVIIGGFGSSMLSAFINAKKPKDVESDI